MKFPPAILDEIRARLPVSEVVGRRVKLRRQGREFAGLSPFNPEKTPSFFVNDQKGFYHCFSSGKHGDVFRFLMETEGLSFPEAVERLASEVGVALPKPDAREERRERERASLADVCEMAARFYEEALRLSGGDEARRYVVKRALRPETLKEFRMGFAPAERDALKRHLIGKGVDEEAMIAAGLLIKPDDGRPTYDRFRNRLMIPIQDDRGRVVAFGGRALSPEDKPKYLNSPETELFHKGLMLFNGHRARAAAYEEGAVVVVEGYLDAIAVYQAGVKAVVATLGTAFTEDHIQRLWKLAPEPVICFDGDRAGIGAAHRAIDRILPQLKSGYSFNFAFLPDGKDPDELVQSGGKDAFLAEIGKAQPLADVLWDRETVGTSIDTPERKAALEKRFEDLTGEIKDARVQKSYRLRYRLRLSNLFWQSERYDSRLNQNISARSSGKPYLTVVNNVGSLPVEDPNAGLERILLGMYIDNPEVFVEIMEHVYYIDMLVPDHEMFKRELLRIISEYDDVEVRTFYREVDPKYFAIFEVVHGKAVIEDGIVKKTLGYRLRERLPILKFHPPISYVEQLIWHFLDRLQLLHIEIQLQNEAARLTADCTLEDEARILGLSREIGRRREEFARREQELAEEAKLIRAAFGSGTAPGTPLLTHQR